MSLRVGDEVDDYCTRCHRLTNHSVSALVGDTPASTTCRTCGFRHPYRGGTKPARASKPKTSAFDQVLAGILGDQPEPPATPKRPRRKRP
ncbi:MAG: hypothetical protein ACRD1Y_05060 [Terriglobales bacterium]